MPPLRDDKEDRERGKEEAENKFFPASINGGGREILLLLLLLLMVTRWLKTHF